jgi:hypothetical protein
LCERVCEGAACASACRRCIARCAASSCRIKKLIPASERDTEKVQGARHAYAAQAVEFDLWRLKFVDDSGINVAMTRLYGRVPRGKRVTDSVPQNCGENVTLLGALSAAG